MGALIVRAAIAALLVPAIAGAQTLRITEAEALSRFGTESPQVQAALSGVELARADVLAAGRWPNPRVVYNREAVAGIAETMLSVSQAFPITGRRALEVRAAAARAEAQASWSTDKVRRLRADLRLAFVGLWAAQTRERELAANHERLRHLAALLAVRESAGEAAGFDGLRAEREVIDADAERAGASAERMRAQAVLASYFATPPAGGSLEAVASDRATTPIPSVEELVSHAQSSRSAFAALARDLEAASYAERAAARRMIPEPEVVVGTKTSSVGGGEVGSLVSVHVAIPLFDRGGPEGAVARARTRLTRTDAEVFRRTLAADVAAWHAAVVERRAAAQRYRAAITSGVGEIERIAQVGYDAGEQSLLELLDAYRTSAEARVRQVALDAAAREAEIELEFVSGWEMP